MTTPAELINHVCHLAKLDGSLTALDVGAYQSYDSSGGSYANDTTDANDDDAGDATMPDPFDSSDAILIGHTERFDRIRINVGTAGAGDAVAAETTWEYFNGAGWSTLTVTDGTTSLTVSGTSDVTFTPPADWFATTLNSAGPYFYVRMRATANDVYNTTQPLLTRISVIRAAEERRLCLTWLQEAVDRLCFDAEINNDPTQSVSLTSGTAAYTFGTSPFSFTDIIAVNDITLTDGSVTSVPLERVTMREILELEQGAGASGTPYVYAVEYPSIRFFPTPGAGTTINVSYVADGTTLSDSLTTITLGQSAPFPKALQWGTLFNFVMSRALAYKKQDGAGDYLELYQSDPHVGLPAVRRWVARAGGMQRPTATGAPVLVSSPSQDVGW